MLIVLFVSKACRSHNNHPHMWFSRWKIQFYGRLSTVFGDFLICVFWGEDSFGLFRRDHLWVGSQVKRVWRNVQWSSWQINKIYGVVIARFVIEVLPAQNQSITGNFNTERRSCRKRSKLCNFVGNFAIGLDLSTHQTHPSIINSCCMQQKAFLSFSLSL